MYNGVKWDRIVFDKNEVFSASEKISFLQEYPDEKKSKINKKTT